MLDRRSIFAFVLTASAVPFSSLAHHSAAPHFHLDTTIEVEGVVTRLALVNPHAYVYFDVTQDGDTVEWRCELRAGTILERQDWSDTTLPVGAAISITGSPARREDNVCKTDTISLNGGEAVDVMQVGRVYPAGETLVAGGAASGGDDIDTAPEYRDDGQPNITGYWVAAGRNANGRAQWPQTAAGIAASSQWDYRFDFEELQCRGSNIFETLYHDRHINQFTQYDDRIELLYGFMDVLRVIHLDMDSHPADIEPSMEGHSIGRWEGKTLIVDTVGFQQGAIVPPRGILHSADMHTTERFTLNDDGNIHWEFTATDPFLAEPFTGELPIERTAQPYEPYNCVELSGQNNIRPSEE